MALASGALALMLSAAPAAGPEPVDPRPLDPVSLWLGDIGARLDLRLQGPSLFLRLR